MTSSPARVAALAIGAILLTVGVLHLIVGPERGVDGATAFAGAGLIFWALR